MHQYGIIYVNGLDLGVYDTSLRYCKICSLLVKVQAIYKPCTTTPIAYKYMKKFFELKMDI